MVAKKESCALETSSAAKLLSRVAELNDAFRKTCSGGTLAVTAGVIALGRGALPVILNEVRAFDAFTPENDPYGKHDFGSVEWLGTRLFWKIDYYDVDMRFASPDPVDQSVTARVLTIMLAEEY